MESGEGGVFVNTKLTPSFSLNSDVFSCATEQSITQHRQSFASAGVVAKWFIDLNVEAICKQFGASGCGGGPRFVNLFTLACQIYVSFITQ